MRAWLEKFPKNTTSYPTTQKMIRMCVWCYKPCWRVCFWLLAVSGSVCCGCWTYLSTFAPFRNTTTVVSFSRNHRDKEKQSTDCIVKRQGQMCRTKAEEDSLWVVSENVVLFFRGSKFNTCCGVPVVDRYVLRLSCHHGCFSRVVVSSGFAICDFSQHLAL